VQEVEDKSKVNQTKSNGAASVSAWSYRLVVTAILSVTIAFIVIMGMFALLKVFDKDNAANITAALSSLFGIVGTLVGAYFGIKASGDAQDRSAETAQQAVTHQKETAQQAVADQKETAKQAVADQKETAKQAVETSQRTRGTSPMALAIATLIPVAGGASLLALRYYLKRMQNAS
jgi:biopolymer transport protein ExbB/TolQ